MAHQSGMNLPVIVLGDGVTGGGQFGRDLTPQGGVADGLAVGGDAGQQAVRQPLVQGLAGRVTRVGGARVGLARLVGIIRLIGSRHRFAPSVLVVGPERPMNDAYGWWGILTKLLGWVPDLRGGSVMKVSGVRN